MTRTECAVVDEALDVRFSEGFCALCSLKDKVQYGMQIAGQKMLWMRRRDRGTIWIVGKEMMSVSRVLAHWRKLAAGRVAGGRHRSASVTSSAQDFRV